MRVFVTGATGFIGSALVKELILAGHEVTGLYRDEAKRAALEATGATALHGDMKDYKLLTRAAAESDGVAHLAFNHDFSTFMANCEDDRHVVAALGAGLAGSKKPLIVTSGTGIARNEAVGITTDGALAGAVLNGSVVSGSISGLNGGRIISFGNNALFSGAPTQTVPLQ